MDDRLLGERRLEIADRSTVAADPAIDPGVEDSFTRIEVVGVGLEVVDNCVRLSREVPDIAFPSGGRLGVIDLIDLPVVRLTEDQIARA